MKMGGPTWSFSRRTFVAGSAATAAMVSMPAIAKSKVVKVGYVSPQTGPLAVFGETDNYVIKTVRAALKRQLKSGGKDYEVEFIVKDSQSNPNRASEVASQLITRDRVQLMMVASTPDTTNPVGDQCELNEVPCVSTAAPWQAWYFGRGATPKEGFDWTYHFFFGLEDGIAVYQDIWKQLSTNKVVAALFPNDSDGKAWGDLKRGIPAVIPKAGFRLIDPGRYQNLSSDFTPQINEFKRASADIVTGVMLPPDWTTFWKQARQQGFRPKIATVAKALVFPRAVETLGDAADGLSTEVVWSPNHPFKSSLLGTSSAEYAVAYEKGTGRQWTPPLGWIHALFEVAIDSLRRSGDPFDKKAVINAISNTDLGTILGPVSFKKGPVKNVARTPLVGGQWRLGGGRHKYRLEITANETAPIIPRTSDLVPIPYR